MRLVPVPERGEMREQPRRLQQLLAREPRGSATTMLQRPHLYRPLLLPPAVAHVMAAAAAAANAATPIYRCRMIRSLLPVRRLTHPPHHTRLLRLCIRIRLPSTRMCLLLQPTSLLVPVRHLFMNAL
jgi:hypothetical protein